MLSFNIESSFKQEIPSLLSKIGFSTQRRKGRRETDFLFGGERPPNKKASVNLG